MSWCCSEYASGRCRQLVLTSLCSDRRTSTCDISYRDGASSAASISTRKQTKEFEQWNSCEEQHSGWKQDRHEDDKHWMCNWSHETNSSNCVSQLMSWPPWNNRMFHIFLFATVPSLPFLPFVYPFKFFSLLTFFFNILPFLTFCFKPVLLPSYIFQTFFSPSYQLVHPGHPLFPFFLQKTIFTFLKLF